MAPSSLFAALNATSGKAIRPLQPHSARSSSRSSSKQIDTEVPAKLDVHLILDNYATYKRPQINKWLAVHPASSSTSRSQRQEDQPRRALLRRADRAQTQARPPLRRRLNTDIEDWIDHWNESPTPLRMGQDHRTKPRQPDHIPQHN
jgi:hypothetical protein